MKFKVRVLIAGFTISFLVVALLTAVLFLRVNQLDQHIARVEHSYTVINVITQLNETMQAQSRSSFRYTAFRDARELDIYHAEQERWNRLCDSLKMLTSDNQEQRRLIVILQADAALFRTTSEQLMAAISLSAQDLLQSATFAKRRAVTDTAAYRLEQMKQVELSLLQQRMRERNSYMQLTTSLLKTLALVFGVLTLVTFFFLLREFRRRIRFQEELEQKVEELRQSKKELEDIAYATSHDLQEPLRKIRILTDKWHSQYKGIIDSDSKSTMERVVAAAARMQELVAELMSLSSLNADVKKTSSPLKKQVAAAMDSLQTAIDARKAVIEIGELPVIEGYPDQLKLLFRNLLDNSLKFCKPDSRPQVRISCRTASGSELPSRQGSTRNFICVMIEDDGLGFENRQAEKMFGIFRQLHDQPEGYRGKGAGLAICQRIMNNHGGYILAHSFPGEGATFKLYFPV